MVTVRITGDLALKEITIDPDAIDPEDAEMLQDMVLAAVNEAIRAAQELAADRASAASTGGMDLGGARPAGHVAGTARPLPVRRRPSSA